MIRKFLTISDYIRIDWERLYKEHAQQDYGTILTTANVNDITKQLIDLLEEQNKQL
jgi:hypothetical protein